MLEFIVWIAVLFLLIWCFRTSSRDFFDAYNRWKLTGSADAGSSMFFEALFIVIFAGLTLVHIFT